MAGVTFVLVRVQEVLELSVEDLQVLLYEDLLTFPGQLVLGGFMEVNLHAPLLLQQTGLRLGTKHAQRFTPDPEDSFRSTNLRASTFFMYSVTGFCCRNSVLSRV